MTTTTTPRPVGRRARVTRVTPPPGDRAVRTGDVPDVERERLAATLGALLRAERLAAGYSTRRLARAVGCSRSTIRRLQAGQLRPREVTLRYLASVLAVDDPGPLAERLIEAAGASLRPDTPGAIRSRHRRAIAAQRQAGTRPGRATP